VKNPISRTAYYTLGIRAADAARRRPICGDTYAQLFLDEDAAKVWEEFKSQKDSNDSVAARHRIIDELVREELVRDPGLRIVIIGAGFDTRAFRIGGGRWLEVDEPAIIEVKEEKLPAAQARGDLVRVPIEFAHESLEGKLAPYASVERTVIIVEGVFMYLTLEQREALVATLKKIFPRHMMICDLMRRRFFEKFSKRVHDRILKVGASFAGLDDEPDRFFTARGYSARAPISILMAAKKWGGLRAPGFLVRRYKPLRTGYEVWVFERE